MNAPKEAAESAGLGGETYSRRTGASDFGPQNTRRSEGATRTLQHLDLEDILGRVKETVYHWDFASDRIEWAHNAETVLGIDQAGLACGRAFALRVDPDQAGQRYDAITGGRDVEPGSEVSYRVQYRFLPQGRRNKTARWVEEIGVCQIGADGRPVWAQGVLRVIDHWREQEERLLFLGSHDELTGQLNRTRLTEALTQFLSQPPRPGHGAFLLAAVNDLTTVNEAYGFEVGDEVIAIVGRRLARGLRGKDRIGRFSSNKFGILLHHCTEEGLAKVANRLMTLIKESVLDTSLGAVAASISIGAVLLPKDADSAQLAIGRALHALEVARSGTSSRFARFEPCQRRERERRRNAALADEIVRALNDRRMLLALQPIVTSKSREPELYECLLRMRRLDGEIMAAAEFVPVAEQFGLARLIDHRALELVVDLLRASPDLKLAINVSADTTTDLEWVAALEAFTGNDRSLTERLMVEITETAAISDLEDTVKFVRALQALGCRVALDDFGAGYTSFRNLKLLGVDMVKIDGSFIQSLTMHAADEHFVRTLIELARNFGIATVGEWVGDERTALLLERAGVGYMQGYFFGTPEIAERVPSELPTRKS